MSGFLFYVTLKLFMIARMGKPLLLVLLLCVLLAACSPLDAPPPLPPTQTQIAHKAQLLWTNPLALPDVVEGLSVTPTDASTSGRLCVTLSQAFIWEPGDGLAGTDATTFNSVQRSLRVEVDDVAQSELEVMQTFDVIFRRDANGNPAGSHGGAISVCFSAAELAIGMHVGHLKFQSTSGREFAYEWSFRVAGASGARTVELPEAITDS